MKTIKATGDICSSCQVVRKKKRKGMIMAYAGGEVTITTTIPTFGFHHARAIKLVVEHIRDSLSADYPDKKRL